MVRGRRPRDYHDSYEALSNEIAVIRGTNLSRINFFTDTCNAQNCGCTYIQGTYYEESVLVRAIDPPLPITRLSRSATLFQFPLRQTFEQLHFHVYRSRIYSSEIEASYNERTSDELDETIRIGTTERIPCQHSKRTSLFFFLSLTIRADVTVDA